MCDDGLVFLYFDGHCEWRTTVHCSDNPLDNVFAAEGGVCAADTDSWLRRP